MSEGRQRKNSCLQLLWSISADDVQNAKENRASKLYDTSARQGGQKAPAAATGLGLLCDT